MPSPGVTHEPELDRSLTVRELLEHEVLSEAELIAGSQGLDRAISALNVMTVPEIGEWVKHDEFLLATGYPLPRDDQGQVELLRSLHQLGLAGIGIKLNRYVPDLSSDVVAEADKLGLPLVLIPERVRFDDILSHAFTTIVNRQAAALARAQKIHQSFLAVSLSGGGLGDLADELSSLLGDASVMVADQHGVSQVTAGDPAALEEFGLLQGDRLKVAGLRSGLQLDPDLGRRWVAGPIRAGDLHHGFVVAAEADRPFGEFALVAVEQAAVVAALEITRTLAVNAVERQFSSNALYELMTSAESEMADSAARGFGFGWDLDRDVVVLAARKEGSSADDSGAQTRLDNERALEFWTSAVRSKDRTAAAAGLGAEMVAVVGADLDIPAAVRSIQTEVARFVRHQYSVGVSRTHLGPLGVPAAYQEARVALRVGQRISGAGAVTFYDDLGFFKLLAQIGDAELQAFADETLGPLTALPDPDQAELLRTLETLVENNMNMAKTARELHYHYNTLRYRLARLEKLLGPFSSNSAAAVKVSVALQVRQIQARSSRPHA